MIPPTRRRNLLVVAGAGVLVAVAVYFGQQYKKQHEHEAIVAQCETGEPTACSQLCNAPESPSASACLKLGIMYGEGSGLIPQLRNLQRAIDREDEEKANRILTEDIIPHLAGLHADGIVDVLFQPLVEIDQKVIGFLP